MSLPKAVNMYVGKAKQRKIHVITAKPVISEYIIFRKYQNTGPRIKTADAL